MEQLRPILDELAHAKVKAEVFDRKRDDAIEVSTRQSQKVQILQQKLGDAITAIVDERSLAIASNTSNAEKADAEPQSEDAKREGSDASKAEQTQEADNAGAKNPKGGKKA